MNNNKWFYRFLPVSVRSVTSDAGLETAVCGCVWALIKLIDLSGAPCLCVMINIFRQRIKLDQLTSGLNNSSNTLSFSSSTRLFLRLDGALDQFQYESIMHQYLYQLAGICTSLMEIIHSQKDSNPCTTRILPPCHLQYSTPAGCVMLAAATDWTLPRSQHVQRIFKMKWDKQNLIHSGSVVMKFPGVSLCRPSCPLMLRGCFHYKRLTHTSEEVTLTLLPSN